MTGALFIGAGLVGAGMLGYAIKELTTGGPTEDEGQGALPPVSTKPGDMIKLLNEQEKQSKLPKHNKKEVTTLAKVSELWTAKTLHLRDVAVIWREVADEAEDIKKIPRPSFKSERIDRFFVDYVMKRPVVKGDRRTVIIKLLKILDAEGSCPSVVTGCSSEPENKLPDNAKEMLSGVPLYEHTLEVAEHFVTCMKHEAMLPDVLIVSLGHDIGKVPSYHSKMYQSADHAQISVSVLNGMPEYIKLANRAELSSIIANHHAAKTDNFLTMQLQKSDHESRGLTFARLLRSQVDNEKSTQATGEKAVTNHEPKAKTDSKPDQESVAATNKVVRDLFGEQVKDPMPLVPKETGTHVPVGHELPPWFKPESLLSEIRKSINVVTGKKSDKIKWDAVTSGEMVYVQQNAFWGALSAIGGSSDPEFLAASCNEATKKDYMYSVVNSLAEQDFVPKTYLPVKGGYMTQCYVISRTGGTQPFYLIPIRISAFGETSHSLESIKSVTLKSMVREIKPKVSITEQKCDI